MIDLETPRGAITFRELRGVDDMEAAEIIQSRVWGEDAGCHPKELLIAAQHEGGFLAAAFTPGGDMVGLVFSFPTREPDSQHSQLLATLEEWRGFGIGTALKWFQCAWCLENGISRVRWTVDPLRVANAELNIRHLGATAAIYLPDYYGPMKGIDAGAPSDRLLVDWRLGSPRVSSRAERIPEDAGFPKAQPANRIFEGGPVSLNPEAGCDQILIRLPENFISLSKVNSDLALRWRLHVRELLSHYFNLGYVITEFTRQGECAYLLERQV